MKEWDGALPASGWRIAAALTVLGMVAAGCSLSGTGTVKVKDRAKIAESLEKGSRPTTPGGKAGVTDDLGVKFRKKSP